jgi:hypothetical protein
MRVLGSIPFNTMQQRWLIGGASIDLPRAEFADRILARAQIGDLIWVKEPWALLRSRQFGPQNVREAVVGPVGTAPSARIRPIMNQLKWSTQSPLTLERGDSRATLEVMGISDHAIRVLVHMKQVDALLAAGRVA